MVQRQSNRAWADMVRSPALNASITTSPNVSWAPMKRERPKDSIDSLVLSSSRRWGRTFLLMPMVRVGTPHKWYFSAWRACTGLNGLCCALPRLVEMYADSPILLVNRFLEQLSWCIGNDNNLVSSSRKAFCLKTGLTKWTASQLLRPFAGYTSGAIPEALSWEHDTNTITFPGCTKCTQVSSWSQMHHRNRYRLPRDFFTVPLTVADNFRLLVAWWVDAKMNLVVRDYIVGYACERRIAPRISMIPQIKQPRFQNHGFDVVGGQVQIKMNQHFVIE